MVLRIELLGLVAMGYDEESKGGRLKWAERYFKVMWG